MGDTLRQQSTATTNARGWWAVANERIESTDRFGFLSWLFVSLSARCMSVAGESRFGARLSEN